MRQLAFKGGRRMAGVSLLETLVALLLLSVGVLAMAAVHAAAVKYSKLAQYKGLATQYSNEIVDRMRANPNAATAGDYNRDGYDPEGTAETIPACAILNSCTPAEVAAIDNAEVFNEVRLGLPAGGYLVQQDGALANVVTVWMIWQEQESVGSDASDSSALLTGCPVDADPAVRCVAIRVAL